MRIVHFSDIHFGRPTKSWKAYFDKRLLGILNYFVKRRQRLNEQYIDRAVKVIPELEPDVIICTGDVSCVGSPEEFQVARQKLAPLVENRDIDFIYIPGNHDAYVKSRPCKEELEKTFSYLNQHQRPLRDLPLVVNTPAAELFLINEVQPVPLWSSSGTIAQKDIELFQQWVKKESDKKRVLTGHYPLLKSDHQPLPWRRRLHNSANILAALKEGQLDVSLCGHIHTPFARQENSGTMEICAGSLSVNGFINILDITPGQTSIRQQWYNMPNIVK